jgi:signal transduction histidine kinase
MNRAHRGQGLGLSVVKDLVEFMDGEILFESKPNICTTFEVTLPKLSKENSLFGDDFMFDGEGINEF